VELDRAALELEPLLAPGSAFEPAAGCELLGATCRVGLARDGAAGASTIVLLEPSTEGRLAVTLARHGEGWCATWEQDALSPERTSIVVGGPLGLERLVLGGRPDGPHRLLVRAVTIEP
jgi:hypothetical protein